MKKILFYCGFFVMMSCSVENDIFGNKDNLFKGELSNKPVLVKLSYIEETFRKAEFSNSEAVEFGLTYLEEPKSERKKMYIEIYQDLTHSRLVEFLPSKSNFPADQFIPSDDFKQLSKLKYSNGIVQGFDKNGNVIINDTYDDRYMVDQVKGADTKELSQFLVNSFTNPDSSANYFIQSIIDGNMHRQLDERTIEISKPVLLNLRSNSSGFEVVKEKIFLNKDKGVVTRIEGYTQSDEIKDLEVNMYGLTADGVHYLKSSHFRNKQYSEAYDIYFLEYSDIFIKDFKFQIGK